MKIRVLIVEDQNIVRSSLRALLERSNINIEVIGEASTGEDAIKLAKDLVPDVVVMDVMLRRSEISGIKATREISALGHDIKIIALSVVEDLAYVKGMLNAGAKGYLFKGCTEMELVKAIHSVRDDGIYFSEEANRVVLEDYVDSQQNPEELQRSKLTEREVQILRFTALGENPNEIAERLKISRKTVDRHKSNMKSKLRIFSDASLTKFALKEGIIHLDE